MTGLTVFFDECDVTGGCCGDPEDGSEIFEYIEDEASCSVAADNITLKDSAAMVATGDCVCMIDSAAGVVFADEINAKDTSIFLAVADELDGTYTTVFTPQTAAIFGAVAGVTFFLLSLIFRPRR